MLEINKIYNEDCLEGMKKIDDKSVDTIITDLPYGQTSRNKWDSVIPFEPLWEQYERVIKDNCSDLVSFHSSNIRDLREKFRLAVDNYLALCEKTGKIPR